MAGDDVVNVDDVESAAVEEHIDINDYLFDDLDKVWEIPPRHRVVDDINVCCNTDIGDDTTVGGQTSAADYDHGGSL